MTIGIIITIKHFKEGLNSAFEQSATPAVG